MFIEREKVDFTMFDSEGVVYFGLKICYKHLNPPGLSDKND
jgi:hypothetical protein